MEIREKILHFIKNENIKREEIARKAKISVPTLSNYLNGNREIPLSFLIKCKIQKNISMHVGRHTFATTYIRNGGNVMKLQKLLGHSQIKHTLVYVHLVESEMLDDMELIKY